MEMYQILLKRLVLLTDEYLKLYDEVKEIKSHLHYEYEKDLSQRRIIHMKIEKIKKESL